MRLSGSSYSQIKKKFFIPKSTLSDWFVNLPKPNHLYYTDRQSWLKKIRVLALKANKLKYQKINQDLKNQVKEDISNWSNINSTETQKTILAFLYWAEGSKGHMVVFANTDPRLCLLFITLLRKCFQLDESKFRVRLHLHDYQDQKVIKKFWSNLLSIPESKFYKIYLKERSKNKTFRRNFGGVCFIKYNSVYLQRKIMEYAYMIGEKLIGKVKVPVV